MVDALTHDNGKTACTLTAKTGFVGCADQHSMWRMSTIFCLIARFTALWEPGMPACFSKLAQFQTFLLGVRAVVSIKA